MAITRPVGMLVYKPGSGALCYSAGGGGLIYSCLNAQEIEEELKDHAVITVSWGSTGRDLDICGYAKWTNQTVDDSDCVGWAWGCEVTKTFTGVIGKPSAHYVWDSGDNTSVAGRERVFYKPSSWGNGNLTFRMHLNYFGYGDSYNSNVCSVTVTGNGKTITKSNVGCATRSNERTERTDKGFYVAFNSSGQPGSINTFN